jgi:hypothetical protein
MTDENVAVSSNLQFSVAEVIECLDRAPLYEQRGLYLGVDVAICAVRYLREIERLRAALELIAGTHGRECSSPRWVAAEALKGFSVETSGDPECQHDLLKPGTTIEVIDKWKAKCKVCIEFFDLPGRPEKAGESQS